MAVVNLRQLVNHPNLPIGAYNNPVNYQLFAEDWQTLRDAIQFGKYGIFSYSAEVTDALDVGGAATIGTTLAVGTNATVGGTIDVTGAVTIGSNVSVTGNISVTGTVDGVDVSTHDHTGGAGGQIPTAGIADGSVTFVKVAGAAIGSSAGTLTSSTLTRGDVTADVKTTIGQHTAIFQSSRNAWVVSRTATGTSAVLNPYTGAEGVRYRGYGATAGNPPVLELFSSGADSGIATFWFNLPPGIESGTLTYTLYYAASAVSAGQAVDLRHGYRLVTAGNKFGVAADDHTWSADYSGLTTTQIEEAALDDELLTTTSGAIATTGDQPLLVAVQRLNSSTSTNSVFLIGISLQYTPSYTL